MLKEQCSTGKIICPYCGTRRDVDWATDISEEQTAETCDVCENTYFLNICQGWTWTTRWDCELNDEQHSFPTKEELLAGVGVRHTRNTKYCLCRVCGKVQLLN